MDVLILGASSIVGRRVVPALRAIEGIGEVVIASRRTDAPDLPGATIVRTPDHVDLLDGPRRLVYVSLENGAHDRAATAALGSGHDVVVDKPAFLRPGVRGAALADARTRGTLLAESHVWAWHPQVARARQLLADRTIRAVTSVFTFPDFPAGSFRHASALGGGALSDLGPYAISAAATLLGRRPDEVVADVHRRRPDGLELSFSVRETYGDAVHLGYYGFGSEYANRLEVIGDGISVVLEPAFTTRADQQVAVRVRERDEVRTLDIGPADTFGAFLAEAVAAVRTGRPEPLRDRLERSGAAFDRLSVALGVDWDARLGAV